MIDLHSSYKIQAIISTYVLNSLNSIYVPVSVFAKYHDGIIKYQCRVNTKLVEVRLDLGRTMYLQPWEYLHDNQ